MRWRLIRRRLSISAPRMSVRSHLPWPVRWVLAALVLGFSGAIGLWAFEFGRNIAGLNPGARPVSDDLLQVRQQLDDTRQERDRAQSLANAADSLIKAERATQMRLTEQVKALESENQALKDDLGFFERLLPASTSEGLSVRGLQADLPAQGQLRFQVLVMQHGGRVQPEFKGRYELLLSGTFDGKPWLQPGPVVSQPLQFKQYRRVDGTVQYPANAVVKQVQVRVLDDNGKEVATQSLRM
ncbi:DUF6776 family protein [Aquabacterium sp. CECT 9606]|uniref:DUF6776 family protein n=1 Tax=Aquabacterium sp. CECT 9606 TaxID=2845822 RepID=UPI001E3CEABB|nr:DUF6776 family protein [Aquabacterium sp. CECT 9606]CAH0348561.1 hypothetical protein AQB9606_00624 [Aquabacterium sp. CECT 9606]